MARTIGQYAGFGDWGKNRGKGTLDAIANLFNVAGGIQGQMKESKQAEAMRQALVGYAKKNGIEDVLSPDTKTVNYSEPDYNAQGPTMDDANATMYDYKTQQPIVKDFTRMGNNPIQVAKSREEVTKSVEEKMNDMSPEDLMSLLALRKSDNAPAKKSGGLTDNAILNAQLQQYAVLDSLDKSVLRQNPKKQADYEYLQKRLRALGILDPYGKVDKTKTEIDSLINE